MKIAIVGSGISGNSLAYTLSKEHDITLFEKNNRLGGHSHTHEIISQGKKINVDTGFIVFNKKTYPLFTKLLDELNVHYEKSDMSFSVFSKDRNFEYNGTTLNTLFSQRKNIFNYKFIKMIYEIVKFNKVALTLLSAKTEISLKTFLRQNNFSDYFCKNYILPMGSAIWSSNINSMLKFPAVFFVKFFNNHGMLNINDRPQWLTVTNGSKEYVEKLTASIKKNIRLNCPVKTVKRNKDSVEIKSSNGTEIFDYIFFACHSDEALKLIIDPSAQEKEVLSSIPYSKNEVTLHTDESIMPNNKLTWAAWNYNIDSTNDMPIALTYNMNILQNLKTQQTILVTLNDNGNINPEKVLKKINYDHPLFSLRSVEAQKNYGIISGVNRTGYAGAYWGNGFHEDGISSAYKAIKYFKEATK
jgi:predicted NAD/FAD-binding protein